jgi:hypothetical protein
LDSSPQSKIYYTLSSSVNGVDQAQMSALNPGGDVHTIRFTPSGDQVINNCNLNTVTDVILPIMCVVTGMLFQRVSSENGTSRFERLDYIEAQKTKTHN